MEDIKRRIDELAGLMEEFSLSEAELRGPDWRIAFRKNRKPTAAEALEAQAFVETALVETPTAKVEEKPAGMPVTSPMNGIFYTAPSPAAPPFIRVGEAVMAGQVIALIEAMKVFNEIVAPMSGTIDRIAVENGTLVQPGDVLLYIV